MGRRIATFYTGDILIGLDILLVKEIFRYKSLTPIPGGSDKFLGIMNLRGKIVTVIDLNKSLNRPDTEKKDGGFLLILKTDYELQKYFDDGAMKEISVGDDIVSFVIDKMDNVLDVEDEDIIPPPPNLDSIEKKFIDAVIKIDNELVILLNINVLLQLLESSSVENV